MKSSEGLHFVGLDHVRALAVFIVFVYHFLMATHDGVHTGSLSFPVNALIVEGHTGVGMFMTLSGYLFARLTQDRQIDFRAFIYNRALRLAPLLSIVLLVNLIAYSVQYPTSLGEALIFLATGFILPLWPNGGWSITAELHFYLIFPALLLLARKDIRLLLLVPITGIAFRTMVFAVSDGQHVQDLAYWTIVGRIDQFALGMMAALYANRMAGKSRLAAAIAVGWIAVWYGFAAAGGFYSTAHQWLWIALTTVEGAVYATLIAWYDRSFRMPDTGVSGAIGRIGEWSFSIYLLHFFFVSPWANWINLSITPLDNFYTSVAFAIPAFGMAAAIGRLSYIHLEMPFLRYRTSYFRSSDAGSTTSVSSGASKA